MYSIVENDENYKNETLLCPKRFFNTIQDYDFNF